MKRRYAEDAVQRSIVAHLKARAVKDLFWFAVPNGGARSPIEAKIMKGTGTRPGVPDLAFVHEGRAYFLEVKAENGRPSEHQLRAVDDINRAGGFACIAYGLDRALRVLEEWGLVRGVAQ